MLMQRGNLDSFCWSEKISGKVACPPQGAKNKPSEKQKSRKLVGKRLVGIGCSKEPGWEAFQRPLHTIRTKVMVVHMMPESERKERNLKGMRLRKRSAVQSRSLSIVGESEGINALKESAKRMIIETPAPYKSSEKVSKMKYPTERP